MKDVQAQSNRAEPARWSPDNNTAQSDVLVALTSAVGAISRVSGTEELLRALADQAGSLLGARQVMTCLLSSRGECWSIVMNDGQPLPAKDGQTASPGEIQGEVRVPDEQEITAWYKEILRTGRPLRVSRSRQGTEWTLLSQAKTVSKAPNASDLLGKGLLVVLLMAGDQTPVGLMQCSDKSLEGQNADFTSEDESLAVHLAQVAGLALERERMAQACQDGELLTRTIADNVTSGLFMIDAQGYCTFMNRAAEAITGYTLEELRDKPLHDRIHYAYPDGSPFPIEDCRIMQALPENNRVRGHKDIFIRKDGSFFSALCSAEPIFKGGVPVGTVLEVRDTTHEQRVSQDLRESETRFRSLADQAPCLIIMSGPDARVTYINKRWHEYTGLPEADCFERGWEATVHPDDIRRIDEAYGEAFEARRPFSIETRLKGRDGEYRWFLYNGAPRLLPNGEFAGYIGTSFDITERKLAEEALTESRQRLQQYAARLERSNRELEEFATMASHDLQAPLRKIRVFTDHLRTVLEGSLTETAEDDLSRIERSAGRMQSLVLDLLTLSRVTRKGAPFEQVSLEAVLEEVIEDLRDDIEASGGSVTFEVPCRLEADCTQLRQLLQNLIQNALKFRRKSVPPDVRIQAVSFAGMCILTVKDNGIGFKPEHSDRIFQIFQRLHGETVYPGTGIGLAICKKIVERHQGTIKASGEPGQGSVFTVTLPLKQVPLS